jgi:hypothetical protein
MLCGVKTKSVDTELEEFLEVLFLFGLNSGPCLIKIGEIAQPTIDNRIPVRIIDIAPGMKILPGKSRKIQLPVFIHICHVIEDDIGDHFHPTAVRLVDTLFQVAFRPFSFDYALVYGLVTRPPLVTRVGLLRRRNLHVRIAMVRQFAHV